MHDFRFMRRMISAAATVLSSGGRAGGFGQNGFRRDAVAAQIGAAHFAFGEGGVAAGAAGGQDARGPLLAVQKQRMIEAGFENRRGFSAILGRAQNHDDVGGPHFIDGRLAADVAGHCHHPGQRDGGGQGTEPGPRSM